MGIVKHPVVEFMNPLEGCQKYIHIYSLDPYNQEGHVIILYLDKWYDEMPDTHEICIVYTWVMYWVHMKCVPGTHDCVPGTHDLCTGYTCDIYVYPVHKKNKITFF